MNHRRQPIALVAMAMAASLMGGLGPNRPNLWTGQGMPRKPEEADDAVRMDPEGAIDVDEVPDDGTLKSLEADQSGLPADGDDFDGEVSVTSANQRGSFTLTTSTNR